VYELLTIAFSHYCEKARWALDRARVPYRERRFMPGLHVPFVARALMGTGRGRADRASSRFSTPLLRGPNVLLTDSTDIVRWADASYGHEGLYADPEAAELEAHFGTELGPHTRRIVYWYGLRDRALMLRMAKDNVSPRQARAFALVLPFVARAITDRLGVDEPRSMRSVEKVEKVVQEIDARLADGRRYLLGDRFSAADLAFASLFAPVVVPTPDRFGAVLPKLEQLHPDMQRWALALRARPAGKFAARMFEQERRKPG
jgi:glutathione S-transferase